MPNVCAVCGRGSALGRNVSKANNKTRRTFNPNLQRVRIRVGGLARKARVCTSCLKAQKVQKA